MGAAGHGVDNASQAQSASRSSSARAKDAVVGDLTSGRGRCRLCNVAAGRRDLGGGSVLNGEGS